MPSEARLRAMKRRCHYRRGYDNSKLDCDCEKPSDCKLGPMTDEERKKEQRTFQTMDGNPRIV